MRNHKTDVTPREAAVGRAAFNMLVVSHDILRTSHSLLFTAITAPGDKTANQLLATGDYMTARNNR